MGLTQFVLDEPTQRILTVCHRSGLYVWLRMPFGPAPAPAEMQSYVARVLGVLRSRVTGEPFCTPLMDDIHASSPDFTTQIDDVCLICETAEKHYDFNSRKAPTSHLSKHNHRGADRPSYHWMQGRSGNPGILSVLAQAISARRYRPTHPSLGLFYPESSRVCRSSTHRPQRVVCVHLPNC